MFVSTYFKKQINVFNIDIQIISYKIQNFKCLFCKRLTKIIEWAKRDKVLSVAKNKLITIFIRLLDVSRKQETKNETGCQEVHLQIQGGGSGGGSLFQFAFHAFHALKTDIKLSLIQGFFILELF